ncbi:hypothetical protein NDU88_007370 [Pleurodeles waltl]|uniref:Uncharacterized protein n=1 Tax=Pleurodeles waltl TaxID=8319 RepID=A0AAV7NW14_PLEWA|nr:hypothetical protein NDU88_007370 [Pleurodeles waltl]
MNSVAPEVVRALLPVQCHSGSRSRSPKHPSRVPSPSGPTPKDCCRSADRAWKRVGSLLGTRDVCESGIGSLASERAYGLSSRGEPRPQVRRGAAD